MNAEVHDANGIGQFISEPKVDGFLRGYVALLHRPAFGGTCEP